jgi:hypothetical protein
MVACWLALLMHCSATSVATTGPVTFLNIFILQWQGRQLISWLRLRQGFKGVSTQSQQCVTAAALQSGIT